MRKVISSFALLTTVLSLLGCVSQPQNVKSNLPLVNQSYTSVTGQFNEQKTASANSNYAMAIPELNVVSNKPLVIDGKEYQVSASYMSAMGAKCHRLARSNLSGAQEVRPVCHYDSYWLLYPALVSSRVQ
ncbi:hypothetical protein [Alteromonas gilva]|uniref:Lipoprotein n=1 Tax=Alteromonas gilva TaxID=2987522 RepID=A0ABT5L720_9ALTE|nr:hypothetical protein [Alteromonas gilva]MDC8832678.1 hypothetical protein [Alteromonas gilva]